ELLVEEGEPKDPPNLLETFLINHANGKPMPAKLQENARRMARKIQKALLSSSTDQNSGAFGFWKTKFKITNLTKIGFYEGGFTGLFHLLAILLMDHCWPQAPPSTLHGLLIFGLF